MLEGRVAARRRNFNYYYRHLADLPGIEFMTEPPWGRHTRWLTTLTIDHELFGAPREDDRLALEAANIEPRPVWKPMHLQPVFRQYEVFDGAVAERVFRDGLCLPSGSRLTEEKLSRVVAVIRRCYKAK